jgi:DNA polymerase-3 subunit beta
MFDVSIRNFTKAASIVACAVERRNTIPILGAMKVHANGRLVIEGTNLDMVVTATIDCDTRQKAEILIDDHRAVISAIGAAGGELVTFEASDGGFRTRAGRLNRTAKNGMKVKDWPDAYCSVDHEDFGATFTAAVLKQIERVIPAISTEETRYYLNGVFMHHIDGWTYRIVATDGHRLMAADVQLPDAKGTIPPLIIPAAFVRNMVKHFRQSEGPLQFKVGRRRLDNAPESTLAPTREFAPRVALSGQIKAGGFSADVAFSGKTIDGTYPDYTRVIPSPTHTAVIKVAELRQAVLAVSAGNRHLRAVSLSFGPDGVDIDMGNAEGVSSSFRVEAVHNMPDGFKIGLNGKYVLDLLSAFHGDEVSFAADDAAVPTLWRDMTDGDFRAVLMPMRV